MRPPVFQLALASHFHIMRTHRAFWNIWASESKVLPCRITEDYFIRPAGAFQRVEGTIHELPTCVWGSPGLHCCLACRYRRHVAVLWFQHRTELFLPWNRFPFLKYIKNHKKLFIVCSDRLVVLSFAQEKLLCMLWILFVKSLEWFCPIFSVKINIVVRDILLKAYTFIYLEVKCCLISWFSSELSKQLEQCIYCTCCWLIQ